MHQRETCLQAQLDESKREIESLASLAANHKHVEMLLAQERDEARAAFPEYSVFIAKVLMQAEAARDAATAKLAEAERERDETIAALKKAGEVIEILRSKPLRLR